MIRCEDQVKLSDSLYTVFYGISVTVALLFMGHVSPSSFYIYFLLGLSRLRKAIHQYCCCSGKDYWSKNLYYDINIRVYTVSRKTSTFLFF